jgi:hypothetical protein
MIEPLSKRKSGWYATRPPDRSKTFWDLGKRGSYPATHRTSLSPGRPVSTGDRPATLVGHRGVLAGALRTRGCTSGRDQPPLKPRAVARSCPSWRACGSWDRRRDIKYRGRRGLDVRNGDMEETSTVGAWAESDVVGRVDGRVRRSPTNYSTISDAAFVRRTFNPT